MWLCETNCATYCVCMCVCLDAAAMLIAGFGQRPYLPAANIIANTSRNTSYIAGPEQRANKHTPILTNAIAHTTRSLFASSSCRDGFSFFFSPEIKVHKMKTWNESCYLLYLARLKIFDQLFGLTGYY